MSVIPDDEPFAKSLRRVLSDLELLLLSKNERYGNSALEPSRVFSKADATEQIKVRIDDKLSRISTSKADDTEDSVTDLIGYLVLLKIAQAKNDPGQTSPDPDEGR